MIRLRDLLAAFGFGAVANFPWELASTRFAGNRLLYRGVPSFTWGRHLVCCGLASLADGAGIALIFWTGAAFFGEARWTHQRDPGRLALVVLLGIVGAVLTEQLALRLGWWAYGPAMPRLQGTDLGISPLVQFIVLPVLVLFWVLPGWWRRYEASH